MKESSIDKKIGEVLSEYDRLMELKRNEIRKDRNELNLKLGQRIAEIRIRNGLTQEALAAKSDLDTTYLSRLERGKTNPSFYFIRNIIKGLDLTTDEIISLFFFDE